MKKEKKEKKEKKNTKKRSHLQPSARITSTRLDARRAPSSFIIFAVDKSVSPAVGVRRRPVTLTSAERISSVRVKKQMVALCLRCRVID